MVDTEDTPGKAPNGNTSRRRFLLAAGTVSTGLLAGCSGGGGSSGDGGSESGGNESMDGAGNDSMNDGSNVKNGSDSMNDSGGDSMDDSGNMTEDSQSIDDGSSGESEMTWRSIELTTVRDGETFTVNSFDKPVVLETFAVWCPKCKRQQEHLTNLDDSVVVVSLNTDPNEDAAKVKKHAEENGFDWRYAVAPPEMTKSLIDEFGPSVTNAPSTPVIVACPGGATSYMSGSINSASKIMDAAKKC